MILTPTVFVLGAGANVPYGFSTGGRLLDKARNVDPMALLGNAGRQVGQARCIEFNRAIGDNMLPSIDALLEHRRDLWPVGKRVMATLLYQEEQSAAPISNDEDWMSLLFEKMSEGAATLQEFANNTVAFITFNYDRYLEQRFIRGLVARYNVAPHAAWAALEAMKFTHLYGSLGKLPDQIASTVHGDQDSIPLGAPDTADVYTLGLALQSVEHSIQIVHDDLRPEVFNEASRCFNSARQIFFLGFGFGKQNVTRLRTDQIAPEKSVACTTYGLTAAEIHEYVIPAFPGHALRIGAALSDSPIRKFFRERINVFH